MASMFTQRHYTEVADTVGLTLRQIDRGHLDEPADDTDNTSPARAQFNQVMALNRLIYNLTVTFKEDNGRFDQYRFNNRIELIRREGLQS